MKFSRSKRHGRIRIIRGDSAVDRRGRLAFVNGFSFKGVKRFYQVENASIRTIRAFHGHMREAKYVYVSSGSIILAAVSLDNPASPSKNSPMHRMILSGKQPTVAYIPPGFANGFRALEKRTTVLFFSTVSLKESLADDYRYPFDYWGKDVWHNSQ